MFRPPLPDSEFKSAMAKLASGVAIAACWGQTRPEGVLISSITALSTQPPRVLFCVAKSAGAHDALLAAEECSLSILSRDDEAEAQLFSTTSLRGQRFQPERWVLDQGAPPIYRPALVALLGSIQRRIDAGSHSIIIVQPEEMQARPAAPLVYFDRAFREVRI